MWTPTIYLAGNVGIFQQLLTGINLIFDPQGGTASAWSGGGGGSGAFFNIGVLIQVAMIIGVLGLGAKGILSQRHEWHHVLLGLFIYVALFTPTTSVILDDMYNGESVIVDHIPIGIAYPAGFMSEVGYYMSTELEEADSSVTDDVPPVTLTQGGFAAPLKDYLMLRSAPYNFVKNNENMAHTIIEFVANCTAGSPNFSISADVNNADNVLGAVTTNYNSGGKTVEFTNAQPWGNPNGGLGGVLCSQAANDVNNLWSAFTGAPAPGATTNGDVTTVTVDGGQGQINVRPLSVLEGQLMNYQSTPGPNSTANAGTSLNTTVNNNLDDLMPNCSGGNAGGVVCQASNNGINFVNNEIMGCMATDGYNISQNPYSRITPGTMPYFCLMENAMGGQEAHHAAAASLFEANVMPLETILQFLFFALTPLVAVMLAFYSVQGNYGLFGKYIQFGVWTQSFLPAVALINDYSQYQVQHAMQRMAEVSGNAAEYTFHAMGSDFHHVQLALSNANMMVTLSPLITLAVITGSYYSLSQLAKSFSHEGTTQLSSDLNPQQGTSTLTPNTSAFGMMSTGAGTVMGTNAQLENSGHVDIGAVQSSALTAASAQTASSAASLGSQFATTAQNMIGTKVANTAQQSAINSLSSQLSHQQAVSEDQTAQVLNKLGVSTSSAKSLSHQASAGVGVDILGLEIGEQAKKEGKNVTQQQAETAAASIEGYGKKTQEAYTNLKTAIGSAGVSSSQSAAFDQSQSALKSKSDSFNEAYATQQSLQKSATLGKTDGFNQTLGAQQLSQVLAQKNSESTGGAMARASMMAQIKSADPEAYNFGVKMAAHAGMKIGTIQGDAFAAFDALRQASTNNPIAAGMIAGAIQKAAFGAAINPGAAGQVAAVTASVNNGATTVGGTAERVAGTPGSHGNAASQTAFLGNPQALAAQNQAGSRVNPGAAEAAQAAALENEYNNDRVTKAATGAVAAGKTFTTGPSTQPPSAIPGGAVSDFVDNDVVGKMYNHPGEAAGYLLLGAGAVGAATALFGPALRKGAAELGSNVLGKLTGGRLGTAPEVAEGGGYIPPAGGSGLPGVGVNANGAGGGAAASEQGSYLSRMGGAASGGGSAASTATDGAGSPFAEGLTLDAENVAADASAVVGAAEPLVDDAGTVAGELG